MGKLFQQSEKIQLDPSGDSLILCGSRSYADAFCRENDRGK